MTQVPGTMVNSILEKVLQFFQDQRNREKIQSQCIDPLIRHVLDRLFPYIILTCFLFSMILLMSCLSTGLLFMHLRNMSAPMVESKIL
jgi:hypothetical protein